MPGLDRDSFAPATVVPGTTDPELGFSGGLQGLLTDKLDVTEEERVAVVHSTFLPGESSRIFLHLGEVAPHPYGILRSGWSESTPTHPLPRIFASME